MHTRANSITASVAAAAMFSVVVTASTVAPAGASTSGVVTSWVEAVEPSADQLDFVQSLDPAALAEIEQAMTQHQSGDRVVMAFPIAAAAIAAAAWCAKGALASIPTSVIDDVANGGQGTDYVRNAIIGCLGGEIGGVVWKFLPGWVKKKAIEMVAAFIIKYVR